MSDPVEALGRIAKLDAHKRGCVANAKGEILCSEHCPVGIAREAIAALATRVDPGTVEACARVADDWSTLGGYEETSARIRALATPTPNPPRCATWCGKLYSEAAAMGGHARFTHLDRDFVFCTPACRDAGRSLNPAQAKP